MFKSREDWLLAVVEVARPMFADVGSPLPETVRVGIGRTTRKSYLGECWASQQSDDGHREIWIKPYTRDPMSIIAVLIHELSHAALPFEIKHKKPFVDLARKMFLEGKPTATYGGEPFQEVWKPLLPQFGEYPGGILNERALLADKAPAQKAHLKMCCNTCEINFWITPKFIKKVSQFQCIDEGCGGELYAE
jgi:hypothetical protein